MVMQVATEQTNLLLDLKYVIVENYTSASFITSDNPICLYNKLYVERAYDRNYGLGNSGLIILLPLSPEKCLCFYDSLAYKCEHDRPIVLRSTSQATQINRLIARNAYYNIYYNNKQKESYIKSIIKSYRYIPSDQCVKEHFGGLLIQIDGNSILDKFQIDFLEITPEYKTIKLPLHMGGLTRPYVRARSKDKDILDACDMAFG